jgi:nucleoside-diphosphate-sugar epimerase
VNRVLVTAGVGALGTAIVRRLLRDPDFEVRIADRRSAPDWMREGCEVHTGDLRDPGLAGAAVSGCSHVVLIGHHDLAEDAAATPYTVWEAHHALCAAMVRAALEAGPERVVHVSSAIVFERAESFPTPEEHLADCPPPRAVLGWAALAGEAWCRTAHAEHGLPFTICRPSDPYGPEAVPEPLRRAFERERPLPVQGAPEHTRTPTHLDDVADGIVAAMAHPAGLNEDFNISAAEELTVAEIARMCWEAAGNDPGELELEHVPGPEADVARRWPSAEKAERLLGWRARIRPREGIVQTAAWLTDRQGVTNT